MGYVGKAYALYPHETLLQGDLEFKPGDLIYIISKDDNGYLAGSGLWEGSRDGTVGVFPKNFVQEISSELESSIECTRYDKIKLLVRVKELIYRLQNSTRGINIRKREWNFTMHDDTLVATEFVTWLVTELQLASRNEGEKIGQEIVRKGLIIPVDSAPAPHEQTPLEKIIFNDDPQLYILHKSCKVIKFMNYLTELPLHIIPVQKAPNIIK